MSEYNPIPDAIDFLACRTPLERHAIARLLDTDGPALPVLKWMIEQPDCDGATAATTFWRLRGLPVRAFRARHADIQDRSALLESIAANVRAGRYGPMKIAWDGLEAWDRFRLIGAPQADRVRAPDIDTPALLAGPFGTAKPEPAQYAFFGSPYDADDIFDSLWRRPPMYVATADWLADKSADIWMAAVDELQGSHPTEIHEWMVLQPECPSSLAGQIFWLHDPLFHAKQQLEGRAPLSRGVIDHVLARWTKNNLAPCDLAFSRYSNPAGYRALLEGFPDQPDPLDIPPSLLDPANGRVPASVRLSGDFDFWFIRVGLGGLVPRPRAAALAAWRVGEGAR